MRLNTAHYISLLIFLFFSATTVSLGQCPNNLTVEVSDCGEIQASLNEFGEVGNIIWYWGDDTQSSGANFVSHQYEESGTYSVCVAAWTGECEQGVELCQEVEIEVCGNPCDLDVEVVQDGDVLYFTPSNYPDNADIFWTVNTEGFGSGEEFTYELSEPGAYQICASYETPECPQGVFWCESFFMEAENDCPDEEDFYADNVASSCTSWVFEIGSFVEGEEVFWEYGDGTWEWGGHFTDHQYQEEGEYEVCAYYHSPLCPDTVILCQTILVECEENPCDLDVEVVQDGDVLYFTPSNYPDNANIFWTVNTEGFGSGEEFTYELSEPGAYQICASYETPECPQGVFWCESFFVEAENDCPGEEDFYADNVASSCTSWVFEIGSFVEGEEVYWEYGDGTWEWGGHFTDHQYQEEGEYEVCAYYHSPLCPDTVILCQTILVECEENPCDLDVEVVQDGDVLYFTPSNYPDNANIFWTVNTEGFGSGEEFTYELSEPGAYQICASYETPECPQGVFWCESFFMEDENDCPDAEDFYADNVASSCTSWVFEIGSFVEGEEVYWEYGDGTWELGGHFTDHQYQEEGEYEVCAYYHSPLCPDTVILCQTILVECEENPCDLDVEVVQDGDVLYFTPSNYPDNANIFWTVNTEGFGSGEEFTYELSEPGAYQICASYETPECPQGVFWCESFFVEAENDCPGAEDFYADHVASSCTSWVFEIGSFVEGEEVYWEYGDGTWEWGGHFTDHQYQEEGEYEVCAHYHSPLCPDTVILCQTIIVECEENPCELDVEYEVDGDTLLLYAFNFPENANIWWSVNDGDPIGPGDAYSISIADPGTYEVCAFYETPECPQGVFWCETWTVEGDNCPTGLIYEELECGLYEFTIEGGNDDADVFWNFGNQAYQSDGSPHTHFFEEGVYTVYIIYLDENCQAENYIVELEVPDCGDPECTWFEFEVATNADLLPVELDWSMTSQEGFTAGGGSVSLSGDVVTFNGEVCLMPGCYTLTLSSDFPIGLSDFDFDFPTIPGIPLSIDWIQDDNPFTLHSQIDLAGNCDWSVGLDENALEAVVIYPVPASNHLNIQIPEDTPTEVRLFDATGKVVKQQTIYQSEQISVAEFSSGYYILQLQQGTDFKTFSVPLLN